MFETALSASGSVGGATTLLDVVTIRAASRSVRCAEQMAAVTAEQHVSGLRAVRKRYGRAGNRSQMAARVERETGVVACAVAGVGHVDEVSMDGDADGLDAAGGNGTASDWVRLAVGVDAQDGDLVAACIDREQVLAVTRDLQRPL